MTELPELNRNLKLYGDRLTNLIFQEFVLSINLTEWGSFENAINSIWKKTDSNAVALQIPVEQKAILEA